VNGGRVVVSTRGPIQSGFVGSRHVFVGGPVHSGFVGGHHVFVGTGFGFNHFHHFGFTHFGFHGCFGCFSPFFFGGGFFLGSPFYPYPYPYSPYPYSYYPGDYYGGGYSAPPVAVSSDNGNSNNGNDVQLAADVQRLSDQVEDLRSEERRRYAEDRAAAGSGASLSAKNPAVATLFIFRDGHRISAQSYAITGETLWIFDEHAARKYTLADLDAPATEKANSANGVEFRVPDPTIRH